MEPNSTIQQYNNRTIEKILGLLMLVGAIVFNLWIYRLEPTAKVDPNDNTFQYALVERTNQIWDFANKTCSEKFGAWNLALGAFCKVTYLADHWVPNWAEGYNLPYYYSHVPQIVIVASHRLLKLFSSNTAIQQYSNFSLFQYYHLIIYFLLSFFPLSVFLALRIIRLSWLTAGMGALLASHISTDGLYGLDPASFLWRGYGLSSQLFAMIWLPLAIAYAWRFFIHQPTIQQYNNKTIENGLKQRIAISISQKDFLLSVAFLSATTAGHLGIGIIAFLSIGVIAISSVVSALLTDPKEIVILLNCFIVKKHNENTQQYNNKTIQQLGYSLTKLLLLSGGVFLLLGYWILPILLGGNYHNISFWDPVWKFDSYGAVPTLTRLFNGELFDFGRYPILTILTFMGFFAALDKKFQVSGIRYQAEGKHNNTTIQQYNNEYESNTTYFPFALLFLMWIVFYFGRTTWGGLIDLIPGMADFHLSRFIVGLHITGLFLAPLAIEWIISKFSKTFFIRLFVYSFISLFVYFAVFPQTIRYATHNDVLIKQANENYDKQISDANTLLFSLFSLMSTRPGRVYAGRGGTWGKNLRIAETPYYMYLSTYGIPTVLWLPQTWSPNSDIEQYFSEDQAKDYVLYNIRYVVAPPDQPAQPFWEKIKETNSWKLYEVNRQNQPDGSPTIQQYNNTTIPQMGYITTGVKPATVSVTKENFVNVVRLWIQSDYHKQGLYPELTFDKEYPKTTGLPNFKMLDEVTYQVPDLPAQAGGSTHNLWIEPPVYLPPGVTSLEQFKQTTIQQYNNITIEEEHDEADMSFSARVSVPNNCTECLVILKQTFHPSWQATIDGKPAKTLTVFPFYTAVKLETAGTHEVIFSYRPSLLKQSLLLMSILTLVGILLSQINRVRNRKTHHT